MGQTVYLQLVGGVEGIARAIPPWKDTLGYSVGYEEAKAKRLNPGICQGIILFIADIRDMSRVVKLFNFLKGL